MDNQQHALDNPAYAALAGPHTRLAERCGTALRYPVDVALYAGLPGMAGPRDWADLATLTGDGGLIRFAGAPVWAPDGWMLGGHARLQMTAANVRAMHADEAILLSAADVPDMLDLVASTDPG